MAAVERPWPFGSAATCLAKIIEGNKNLETPHVLSFRNGLTIRKKDGWHRITRSSYPLLVTKVSDGGTPVMIFQEDPLAKTVSQLQEEAASRKPKRKQEEMESEALHPALAAALTDDPDEVAALSAAEVPEGDEGPSRLSTSNFDDEDESPPSSKSQGRRRRTVKLKKG